MKKSLCKVFIGLGLFICAAFSVAAEPMTATVVSAKGKTEIQKGVEWIPLKVGGTVSKGAVIQTGFKSELILKIKDSVVTVAPLSRITIEQLSSSGSKDEAKIFLDTGSLKSNVQKTADRRVGFTVRAPVATASVRGTEFEMKNGCGRTSVYGYEGLVATWKNDSSVSAKVDEGDGGEDGGAIEGNSPAAVSGGDAPKGAMLVRQNQVSSFSDVSSLSPHENSAKKVSDLGGMTVPVSGMAGMKSRSERPKKTGSVKVIITFDDGEWL